MHRPSARRCKLLYPINARRATGIGCVRDARLAEPRIHDVLAVPRAGEPAGGCLGSALRTGGDVLAHELVAIAGGADALRRRAAVMTLVREEIVIDHVLRMRLGGAPKQPVRPQRWGCSERARTASPRVCTGGVDLLQQLGGN